MDEAGRTRIHGHIDAWWEALADFTTLLEDLAPEEWRSPTDLPGWDVHAVAAHIAHLESLLAGEPEADVDIGNPPHVTSPSGPWTEKGVVARREATPAELVAEIRRSGTRRHTALLEQPPDPADPPHPSFAPVARDTETLLRNRVVDVWMHGQDIRRALGRPGDMDSAAAALTAQQYAQVLPVAVAKRTGAPPGTTVVLDVTGSPAAAVRVGDDGRAEWLTDPPTDPTLRISADREAFIILAGGRRPDAARAVSVTGDGELGQRIATALTITI